MSSGEEEVTHEYGFRLALVGAGAGFAFQTLRDNGLLNDKIPPDELWRLLEEKLIKHQRANTLVNVISNKYKL